MAAIQYTIEFTVKPGKLDEFREIAHWFVEQARENEPGTMSYNWFGNTDLSKVYLHEEFADSAGLVAHTGGPAVTSRIGDLLETTDITRWEVYGDPDEAAAEVLEPFGVETFKHVTGFTR